MTTPVAAAGASARYERTVVVDWSARAAPAHGKDTIWIGVHHPDGCVTAENPATRAEAADALIALLADGVPTVVGFDFPLGYPAGFAAAAGLTSAHPGGSPWRAAWAHLAEQIVDGPANANNRWDVAADLNRRLGTNRFWGAPPRRAGPHLTTRKSRPPDPATPATPSDPATPATPSDPSTPTTQTALPDPAEFRHVEIRLRARNTRPFTVWQLLGAGSVGSQVLTGIPVVHRLRHHPALRDRTRIWPFETGLQRPHATVVLAEIWPTLVDVDHVDHPVKDARQVIALADVLADRERAGTLDLWFAPAVPAAAREDVLTEEGWVLGVE